MAVMAGQAAAAKRDCRLVVRGVGREEKGREGGEEKELADLATRALANRFRLRLEGRATLLTNPAMFKKRRSTKMVSLLRRA